MKEKEPIRIRFGTFILIVLVIILILVVIFLVNKINVLNDNLNEKIKIQDENTLSTNEINKIENQEEKSLCHFNPTKGKIIAGQNIYYEELYEDDYFGVSTFVRDGKVYLHVSEPYEENKKNVWDGIFGNLNIKRKINNGLGEEIKGFTKKVDEAKIGGFGQNASAHNLILFLMEDGTVEYISIYDALQTDNLTTRGKIEGLEKISRIELVSAREMITEDGGPGYITTIAIDIDGNFYDINEMIKPEMLNTVN